MPRQMLDKLIQKKEEDGVPFNIKLIKEQINSLEPDLEEAYLGVLITPFNQARLGEFRVNKWSLTKHIAETLGRDTTWIRYRLDKLEKEGLIRAKRSFNSNQWSPKVMPGFKEDADPDFLIPLNGAFVPVKNPLRIYHLAQIPCKPFQVEVKDEHEAKRIMDILIEQHAFLYSERIIPDYSNVLGVEMLEDEEWVEYWNESEGMDWDELEFMYLEP